MSAQAAGQDQDLALDLLPEAPLAPDELQDVDAIRLRPVIDGLTGQLKRYLSQGRQHHRSGATAGAQSMVIALNGPLGQGKSTVLRAVTLRLSAHEWKIGQQPRMDWERRHACTWPDPEPEKLVPAIWGFKRRQRLLKLDVSRLKPEALEHFFWTILLLRSPLFWFLINLVVWSWVAITAMPAWVECLKGLAWFAPAAILLIPVAGSVLLPAFNVLAAIGASYLNWDPSWLDHVVRALHRVKLPFWPDVLLIDDLDRCRVDSQRSLLWALHQRARTLGMAVVVAFDETDLLASEPAPESPDELLRKLVLATYRVPPRTAEDAAWLARVQCHRFAKLNAKHRLAPALADARVAAHLAHLCVLTNQVGPRRMQALLHDAALAACAPAGEIGTELETLQAQLLLTALRQEASGLCRDGVALAQVLEQPSPDAIQKWLSPLGDKHSARARLQRLLALGPSVAPRRHGWHGLLVHQDQSNHTATAVDAARAKDKPLLGLSFCDPADGWTLLKNWKTALVGIASEHGHFAGEWPKRLQMDTTSSNGSAREQHTLELGWTLLCSMWADWPASSRLAVCEWWERIVLAVADGPQALLHSDELAKPWRQELWRLWLTDPEILALMPPASLPHLFQRAMQDHALWLFVASLPSMPETVHDALWRVVVDTRREQGALRIEEAWVRRALQGRLPKGGVPQLNADTHAMTNTELLANVWPLQAASTPDHALKQAIEACTKTYADSIRGTIQQLPLPALQAALTSSRAHAVSTRAWLTALTPLLMSNGQWQPARWVQGELPQPLQDASAWGCAGDWKFSVHHEASWTAAVTLLWAAAPASSMPKLCFQTLPRLLWAGYRRGHRLPANLSYDANVRTWLTRHADESDFQRRRRLLAWLACQWPSVEESLRESAYAATAAWLSTLSCLGDDVAFELAQVRILPQLEAATGTQPEAAWAFHDQYEWPAWRNRLANAASETLVPIRPQAAIRWLGLAERAFEHLNLLQLRSLVSRALTLLGIDGTQKDLRAMPWKAAAQVLSGQGADVLEALVRRVSAIPKDLKELPPPDLGGIQPWIRRWECMLGLNLSDDEDQAESEITSRIQKWSQHLGDDPSTQAAFREAVFAAVISAQGQNDSV